MKSIRAKPAMMSPPGELIGERIDVVMLVLCQDDSLVAEKLIGADAHRLDLERGAQQSLFGDLGAHVLLAGLLLCQSLVGPSASRLSEELLALGLPPSQLLLGWLPGLCVVWCHV
jgi:hypothetical protein